MWLYTIEHKKAFHKTKAKQKFFFHRKSNTFVPLPPDKQETIPMVYVTCFVEASEEEKTIIGFPRFFKFSRVIRQKKLYYAQFQRNMILFPWWLNKQPEPEEKYTRVAALSSMELVEFLKPKFINAVEIVEEMENL